MLEVKLHDIGEGMTEGEIIHYFVKPGDHVKSDQPLVEVQTDKMVAELPSPADGIVKEIIVEPGTTVTVGTTLILIEAKGGAAAPEKQPTVETSAAEEIHKLKPADKTLKQKRVVLAAPYTRKIARDNGVEIDRITGTGPAGRITDEDVYRYIDSLKGNDEAAVAIDTRVKETLLSPQRAAEKKDEETIAFNGRRKQIAKKMVQSLYTIPHVTHFEELEITELMKMKKQLKDAGKNVSLGAFFVKAVQLALQHYPIFNAYLDEEQGVIRLKKEYNIGLATDTEEGLIVPVIHQVEKKSILTIHHEMKECTKKALENKLSAKDLQGSTFTISNVGPLGSIGATPIINYPETALLAFHKTKERPIVKNGEIVIGNVMNVSMSFDHRVADGATAVAFTNRLAELLENPSLLLVELV
ncbi:pyruvate dehydrogenase E2 component (dihydrolipoamide acetyltransferase) [Bacillus oleivorans]|uniref:Dihydrolipoamide acetyltransferase component of pyruvate dehydrogenase complex n=1 Tax=Bacillus oleivorans TaxID=1448271 RepID=A0A285CSA5_9BACI|nr:dihydrolipoamide acetyltransferase family protein [Bacillus oleivorans]SNX69926.1 pyruvate dehydrogenase E2 component (dihydrolipoamide acetyltransferase) [Bacillus oleivorans]